MIERLDAEYFENYAQAFWTFSAWDKKKFTINIVLICIFWKNSKF